MRTSPIDELRQALIRFEDVPNNTTRADVISAARQLIQAIDMQTQVIELYRQHCTPSEEAIRRVLNL